VVVVVVVVRREVVAVAMLRPSFGRDYGVDGYYA